MDDITLTFNPNMFLDAMKKINLGLETMDRNFQAFADRSKSRAEKTKVSTLSIAKGIGVANIAMAGFRKIMSHIPELGRTFSIVGDIFTRNLLWPLRRELIPVLQKVLDWVRDNRAMFVRWGTVIRNVFVVIKNIIGGIVGILKRFWDGFLSNIERAFNVSVGKMTDIANLLVFKISAVVNFLLITIEPVADVIANLFAKAAVNIASFVSGFMDGMGSVTSIITDTMDVFRDLLYLIDRITGSGDTMSKVFSTLGTVIGVVVGGAIRVALSLFDGLIFSINTAVGYVRWGIAKLDGNDREAAKIRKETDAENNRIANRMKQRYDTQKEVIKQAYQNVSGMFSDGTGNENKTKYNPAVTNNTNASNVVNQNITVNNRIDGNKNPQVTADEISKQLKDQLSKERAKAGRTM